MTISLVSLQAKTRRFSSRSLTTSFLSFQGTPRMFSLLQLAWNAGSTTATPSSATRFVPLASFTSRSRSSHSSYSVTRPGISPASTLLSLRSRQANGSARPVSLMVLVLLSAPTGRRRRSPNRERTAVRWWRRRLRARQRMIMTMMRVVRRMLGVRGKRAVGGAARRRRRGSRRELAAACLRLWDRVALYPSVLECMTKVLCVIAFLLWMYRISLLSFWVVPNLPSVFLFLFPLSLTLTSVS